VRKPPILLIVPIVALAVAACGSSSKKSTSAVASAPATTTSAPAANPYGPATTTSAPAATTSAPANGPKISTATISKLGSVLVNAQARTLYMFVPDNDNKVTCVGGCAAVWPPAFVPSGQKPAASGSVKQSLLGSDPDPSGGRVITYAGWPLYTYVADNGPGTATGQAINLNGGLWYVLSPSGKVIKTKP
jgi:predicted lipoprotein with Yx(FWY)xxD motif